MAATLLTQLWSEIKDILEPKPRVVFRIGPIRPLTGPVTPTPQFLLSTPVGAIMANFLLPDDKSCTFSIDPKDAAGNPAVLDSAPVWSTDTPAVLALTPATDGKSCVVKPVGPLTPADGSKPAMLQVNILSEGKSLIGTLAVDVTGGQATTVTIVPGPLV